MDGKSIRATTVDGEPSRPTHPTSNRDWAQVLRKSLLKAQGHEQGFFEAAKQDWSGVCIYRGDSS